MADKNNTVVLKADTNLIAKLKAFYQDEFCEKTPNFAVFQAKVDNCTVTLYNSGKLMFQGNRAEEESSIWTTFIEARGETPQKAVHNSAQNLTHDSVQNQKQKLENGAEGSAFADATAVGSDEVGTGDFFGPIVVTAAYVKESQFQRLIDLGVRDSKKLSDDKIQKIAPLLLEEVAHETTVLSNPEYNEMQAAGKNMNQIKAILHNGCLHRMLTRQPEKLVVVDQFEPPQAYYRHLSGEEQVVKDITFMTKAEDQCMAVACASIISRYCFLNEMKRLGVEYGHSEGLPFGAGPGVDGFGAELIEEFGEEVLPKIAKMNFANVEKVRKLHG